MRLFNLLTLGDLEEFKKVLAEEQTGLAPKSDYTSLLVKSLSYKEFKFAELLIDAGADFTSSLHNTFATYNIEAIKFLLEKTKVDFKECIPLFPVGTSPFSYCFSQETFDSELAGIFLKNGWNINQINQNGDSSLLQTILLFQEDARALDFLCQNGADLNTKGNLNFTPLQLAFALKKHSAFKKLLQFGAPIHGMTRENYLAFYTEMKGNKLPDAKEAYDSFLERTRDAWTDASKYEFLPYVLRNLPCEMFNRAHKEYHQASVILSAQIEKSNIDPEMVKQLCALLGSHVPQQFQKFSNVQMVAELFELIRHPEIIDQRETNLCGPATFLSVLVVENPKLVIDLAFNLITCGKTKAPLALKLGSDSKNNLRGIVEVLLAEIRRSENLVGYSSNGILESFQGLTPPRILEKWLSAVGFTAVEDYTQLCSVKGEPLGKPTQWLVNRFFMGFHAKNHRKTSKEEMFDRLLNAYAHSKAILLLISTEIIDKIHEIEGVQKSQNSARDSILGIPVDHLVHLTRIERAENGVRLEFMTYGRIYKHELSLEEFLRDTRGAVIAQGARKHALTMVQPCVNDSGGDEQKERMEEIHCASFPQLNLEQDQAGEFLGFSYPAELATSDVVSQNNHGAMVYPAKNN